VLRAADESADVVGAPTGAVGGESGTFGLREV
jgi:hypothetical protein